MSELYLQHYGVKGMKWGVRKSRSALYEAKDGLRAAKKYRSTNKTASRASKNLKVQDARNKVRGERSKLRYNNLEKYSSSRLGELQSSYGRGAVKRLSRNTKKGKVTSVKQQMKREGIRKGAKVAAGLATVAYLSSSKGQALIKRNAPTIARYARASLDVAKTSAQMGASFVNSMLNSSSAKTAASQAVRNIQPVAYLPSATKRLRG